MILALLGLLAAVTTAAPKALPAERIVASAAESLLVAAIDPGGPGAAVLVAQGDRVVFRAARGRAEIELGVPVEPAHIFRIGSITKMLTSATVLKLASKGLLSPEDRLSRYMPEYPDANKITIAQLLSHTAGISDNWESDPARAVTSAELVRIIQQQPLEFAPGTEWRYSNSGYMLLGSVIETVSGRSWYDAIADQVLVPLAMTHTGYHGDQTLVSGSVAGYSADSSGTTIRAAFASLTGPGPAGALSSTVDDLFLFERALTHGKLLPDTLVRLMTAARKSADGQMFPYGLGVMLGMVRDQPVIEHNGMIDGFSSQLTFFPDQDVTVIVLTNSDAGVINTRSLAHRLGAIAIGRPYRQFGNVSHDAPVASLAGTYRAGPASVRTVSVRGHRLFVRRDQGPERELVFDGRDILYFPNDRIDYFRVIVGHSGAVQALEFHPDGATIGRREQRSR